MNSGLEPCGHATSGVVINDVGSTASCGDSENTRIEHCQRTLATYTPCVAGCWGQRSGSIERIEETLASTQQRLAANEAHIKSLLSTQVWRRCIAFTVLSLLSRTELEACERTSPCHRLLSLPSSISFATTWPLAVVLLSTIVANAARSETLSLSLNSLAFRAADGKHEGGDQIGRPLDQKFRWSLEAIPLRSVSAPSP